jgi:spore coat polysaccharide biosynthesis protein SpsF (cytidylyltransferase family)
MSAAIVLQARVGSRRLPGKVLAPIAGRTVLAHCIERLRLTSGLPVIVATTNLPEDDVVAAEAEKLATRVVRGSSPDLLARYVQAAREHALQIIVRATADNPAVDLDSPSRTLALLRRTNADYVVERGLPYGGTVEAIDVHALIAAHEDATDVYDREHVNPFIRRHRRFRSLDAIAPGDVRRPDLRFTVDTPDDLDYMRRVLGAVQSSTTVPLAAIIAAAERLEGSRMAGGAGSR